jgi:hypothetical protein
MTYRVLTGRDDFMGTKTFDDLCPKLEKKYGSRFTPPKLLIDMTAKGETFYVRFAPKELAIRLIASACDTSKVVWNGARRA